MYVRLEYSESAGHFHFSRLSEPGENTNGYTTLSSKVKADQAETFAERIRQKFPDHNNGLLAGNLTFSQVQQEFLEFVSDEIKSIRQRMESTHQSRSRVFRKT